MINNTHTNICFDCQNACGGCSWSAINPNTMRPAFKPVPGWTATPIILNLGIFDGRQRIAHTYHITACPQFKPDPPRPKRGGGRS